LEFILVAVVFNNLQIPTIKSSKLNGGSGGSGGGGTNRKPKQNLLPEFTFDVIDMFKDILHNLNNPISIYKMTTISNVKETLGHSKTTWTEDKIFASAMGISLEEYLELKDEK
jgi:hypothetical protein